MRIYSDFFFIKIFTKNFNSIFRKTNYEDDKVTPYEKVPYKCEHQGQNKIDIDKTCEFRTQQCPLGCPTPQELDPSVQCEFRLVNDRFVGSSIMTYPLLMGSVVDLDRYAYDRYKNQYSSTVDQDLLQFCEEKDHPEGENLHIYSSSTHIKNKFTKLGL